MLLINNNLTNDVKTDAVWARHPLGKLPEWTGTAFARIPASPVGTNLAGGLKVSAPSEIRELRSLFAECKHRKRRRRIRHEAADIRIGVASSVQRERGPVSFGRVLVARQPN